VTSGGTGLSGKVGRHKKSLTIHVTRQGSPWARPTGLTSKTGERGPWFKPRVRSVAGGGAVDRKEGTQDNFGKTWATGEVHTEDGFCARDEGSHKT